MGHIKGAVDFEAHKSNLGRALPKDKKTLIVAYSHGPGCSKWKAGADAAKALGYTNIEHLKEGITGWKNAGGAIDKSK